MKHIKRFDRMVEALGVPEGLTDAANNLYKMIFDQFKNRKSMEINYDEGDPDTYRFTTNEIKFNFSLDTDFNIKDLHIPKIDVEVELTEVDIPDDGSRTSEISGAGFTPDVSIDKQKFILKYNPENCAISLVFRFPFFNSIELNAPNDDSMKDFWSEKIVDAMDEHKFEINASLGHELMHFYDLAHIKGGVKFTTSAEYQTVSNLRFGIDAVDQFFHYLYFLCATEAIVKASEVASGMKAMDITQLEFKDFLLDSRLFKKLQDSRDWTVAKFDQKILDDIDHVRQRLKESDLDVSDKTDEEVLDLLKNLVVKNLLSGMLRRLVSTLNSGVNPFAALLGITDPSEPSEDVKQEYFENFRKQLQKDSDDVDKYFASKEKFFKFESQKLIKKLSGLFAMAREVNVNPLQAKITSKGSATRNECILNWEAFLESRGVKPHIETEFNFNWKK